MAFWRSRLGRALSAWIVVGLTLGLGMARVLEVLGKGVSVVWLAVFVLAPLALLVWALVRAAKKIGSPAAAGVVAVAWVAVISATIPLYRASVYLNFWSHRAAYDAIVADMKAGRLAGKPSGRRHGILYDAPMMGSLGFVWYWDFDIGQGIYYDEMACPPRAPPAEPPAPKVVPEPPQPDDAGPPTIKNAGKLHSNEFQLGGHYCYFSVP